MNNIILKVYHDDWECDWVITYLITTKLSQREVKLHLQDIKKEMFWEERVYDFEEFELMLNQLEQSWMIKIEKAQELSINLW